MNNNKGKKFYWYILYIFILIFSFICSLIFAFLFLLKFYSSERIISYLYLVIHLFIFLLNYKYLDWILNKRKKLIILLLSFCSIAGFPILCIIGPLFRF